MTPSAGPLGVALPLGTHPGAGVIIPFVARVGNGAQRCFDVVPVPLVVETPSDQGCDERTSPARTCPAIQVLNKIVIQLYVYSHVLYYTHTLTRAQGFR